MILVYLSGGCDSAAALIEILKSCDYPVHVHHCVIKSARNRWPCELESATQIVEYCREHYRPLEFSTATIDIEHLPTCSSQFDAYCYGLTGMFQMVCDRRISMVAYGYYEYSTAHTLDPMLDKMNENLQQNLVSLYPNHGKNKLEVYESLPDPVKEMIWWCRTPNWLDGFPEPCGKCLACDNIRAVKEGRVPHDV